MKNYEARFDEYLKVLSKNVTYKSAFESIAKTIELSNATKLYLVSIVPSLVGFVSWVLKEAEKTNKNRIYFLSRDGYQMYLIAQRLTELTNLKIECRYLNVSRFSMRTPGYSFDVNTAISQICTGGIDVTPYKVLKRAALSDEECELVLSEIGIESDRNKILNNAQLKILKMKLYKSEILKPLIQEHSIVTYENAIGYLIQEGLLLDNNFIIVDSGWVGTLQCSIEKLLKSVNKDAYVEGYYFGMYEYPKGANRKQFHTYYFSPKHNVFRKTRFSNSLFETIVSSNEGITLGYKKEADVFVPIKSGSANPNANRLSENFFALEKYLGCINDAKDLDDKKIICKLFNMFMANPTTLEIDCYGDNVFSDDILDAHYKNVAANLTAEQIKNQRFLNKLLIILKIKKATIYESAWLEGSAAKCGIGVKEFKHIRFYKFFVHIRKELRR